MDGGYGKVAVTSLAVWFPEPKVVILLLKDPGGISVEPPSVDEVCPGHGHPFGAVPTEPDPPGGQLTVAPFSTEGSSSCSVVGDVLPTHHHSSDDAGGGDCNSPNGADLDSQSTPGLPIPPRPDPTNPALPSLAPSISHDEFGFQECPEEVWHSNLDESCAGIPMWPHSFSCGLENASLSDWLGVWSLSAYTLRVLVLLSEDESAGSW
ncbi:hypothetical protein Nepgr_022955 [Nepenthes gracilis]|uniref:Uncharacterized protein n=1 Tax=Nepenthes gracilis TaxID=150966 RepID=A0AAD3T177_NEPGR|nr:hypothetical protein Nepgr_022955 [Nepenthes gracilis]